MTALWCADCGAMQVVVDVVQPCARCGARYFRVVETPRPPAPREPEFTLGDRLLMEDFGIKVE